MTAEVSTFHFQESDPNMDYKLSDQYKLPEEEDLLIRHLEEIEKAAKELVTLREVALETEVNSAIKDFIQLVKDLENKIIVKMDVTNADLMSIMKEMKIGNEEMRKDLKEDNEKIRKENTDMKSEVKKEFARLSKKVEDVKKDVKDKENKDQSSMKELSRRLEGIEKREKERDMKIIKLAEKEAKVYSEDKGPEREKEKKEKEIEMEKWWKLMREKESEKEIKNKEKDEEKENEEKTSWASRLNNDLRNEGEKSAKENIRKETRTKEKIVEKEKKEKKEVNIKFGDSDESGDYHSNDDWSWSESDGDWQGTIGREEKNKEKRRKNKRKKKMKEYETASKARNMIGIHPLTQKSIDFYNNKGNNFKEAKILAVRDFLENVLEFEKEEVEEMIITDTQISRKGDDVMYIGVQDHEVISEIHKKIAACQNPEIYARNFVPPQFFDRYIGMNKMCAEWRFNDKNLKTQLRFSKSDIEILTKIKGTDEPYRLHKLTEEQTKLIPKFDHGRVWTKRTDRPVRNQRNYSNNHPMSPEKHENPTKRQRTSDPTKEKEQVPEGDNVEMTDDFEEEL